MKDCKQRKKPSILLDAIFLFVGHIIASGTGNKSATCPGSIRLTAAVASAHRAVGDMKPEPIKTEAGRQAVLAGRSKPTGQQSG